MSPSSFLTASYPRLSIKRSMSERNLIPSAPSDSSDSSDWSDKSYLSNSPYPHPQLKPFILPSSQPYTLTTPQPTNTKKSPDYSRNRGSNQKKAATYSPTLHCSTIGASRLNFSVRNGKRWNPAAITT